MGRATKGTCRGWCWPRNWKRGHSKIISAAGGRWSSQKALEQTCAPATQQHCTLEICSFFFVTACLAGWCLPPIALITVAGLKGACKDAPGSGRAGRRPRRCRDRTRRSCGAGRPSARSGWSHPAHAARPRSGPQPHHGMHNFFFAPQPCPRRVVGDQEAPAARQQQRLCGSTPYLNARFGNGHGRTRMVRPMHSGW